MLKNLDLFLSRAEAHAQSKGFDVNNFMGARLAPDMLPFAAQVRIACDSAKATAAGLSGKEAPRYEDNEKTFEELHARIAKTIAFIDGLTDADFTRTTSATKIRVPNPPDKFLRADDYLLGRQIPNFQFHVVTAYVILRHGGVDLGKRHYLGDLPLLD